MYLGKMWHVQSHFPGWTFVAAYKEKLFFNTYLEEAFIFSSVLLRASRISILPQHSTIPSCEQHHKINMANIDIQLDPLLSCVAHEICVWNNTASLAQGDDSQWE